MNKRIIKIVSHKNDYYIGLDRDGNKYFIKNNNNNLESNHYYTILFKDYKYYTQNNSIINMTIDYYRIKPTLIKTDRFTEKSIPLIYKNVLLEKLVQVQKKHFEVRNIMLRRIEKKRGI